MSNMDAELKELEEELERLAPNALPEGLISRMAAAMDGWQEDEREEKVVPFPNKEEEEAPSRSGFWRIAAAVAILGAATALLIPGTNDPQPTVAAASSGQPVKPMFENGARATFEPVSAERSVVNADQHGNIVLVGGVPHRLVRVNCLDNYKYVDGSGAQILVKKPSVDFVLIPLRPD